MTTERQCVAFSVAAICLAACILAGCQPNIPRVTITPSALGTPAVTAQLEPRPTGPAQIAPPRQGEIRVTRRDSRYAVAPGGQSGRFVTGQNADLML